MAKAANEPRGGYQLSNAVGGLGTFQIDGRCFSHRHRTARISKQVLVLPQRSDRKAVHIRVAIEQPPAGVQAIGEVIRLLDRAHEDSRMFRKIPVQRGGTGLGGADDDEVWEHGRQISSARFLNGRLRLTQTKTARTLVRWWATRILAGPWRSPAPQTGPEGCGPRSYLRPRPD